MKKAIRVLQFIWLLPATFLLWFFYVLPLMFIGAIRLIGYPEFLIAEFSVDKNKSPDWYYKLWVGWSGYGGPCFFISNPSVDPDYNARVKRHELEHCYQQFRLGVFFYLYYVLAYLWLLAFTKKHPYIDNPLEVAARKAAGQSVTVSRSEWIDNNGKRILWRK